MRPEHPSRDLLLAMAAEHMSQAELARRTGISVRHIRRILSCKAKISARHALLFEIVLEVNASELMRMQGNLDLFLARKKAEEAKS